MLKYLCIKTSLSKWEFDFAFSISSPATNTVANDPWHIQDLIKLLLHGITNVVDAVEMGSAGACLRSQR